MKTITVDNKHYVECTVVMLPTEHKTKLFIGKMNGQLLDLSIPDKNNSTLNQHLYITTDDIISPGDYALNPFSPTADIVICNTSNELSIQEHWRKIIASTDPQYNLPQPQNQFIKNYIERWNGYSYNKDKWNGYNNKNYGYSYNNKNYNNDISKNNVNNINYNNYNINNILIEVIYNCDNCCDCIISSIATGCIKNNNLKLNPDNSVNIIFSDQLEFIETKQFSRSGGYKLKDK